MMAKVIESKRGNKTLVLNNFKFFIGSVNKYQLIIYIVSIYITKVSYIRIYYFFIILYLTIHLCHFCAIAFNLNVVYNCFGKNVVNISFGGNRY
jgi:hypothetical protein